MEALNRRRPSRRLPTSDPRCGSNPGAGLGLRRNQMIGQQIHSLCGAIALRRAPIYDYHH
jgi:hypothetical protein